MSYHRFTLYIAVLAVLFVVATLFGCKQPQVAQQPDDSTPPPPLPDAAYTPIESDEPLPMVLRRTPQRGSELSPDGVIELLFDRPMNQAESAAAFSVQQAADSPTAVDGQISWPDERTLRFTPDQPLERTVMYDVTLSQAAVDLDDLSLAEPFTFRFNTAGYLEVTQVIPAADTADVETDSTITVMFNRPVVPLAALAQTEQAATEKPVVTFKPSIAGQGEWLNTSIYVFTPSEPLAGGVTYTAQVRGDLQDAAEQTIMEGSFEWQFSTQPPDVVFSSPNPDSQLVDINTTVQLAFNQPIDPVSAAAKFTMRTGNFLSSLLGSEVKGTFTTEEQTLTFTPDQPLAFDTTYNIELEAGVTSLAGSEMGEGSRKAYQFQFTTVPLPEIVSTSPYDGQQDAWPSTSFSIEFNTPINPETVMEHLSMVPPLPITPTEVYTYYSDWSNSFEIYFGAKPSTDYEVRIAPGIEDPYGNKIDTERIVNFRTAPLDPTYRLLMPDLVGLYDASLPTKLIASFTNINELEVTLYRLDEEDILTPQYQWYDYRPTGEQFVRRWRERLESPLNQRAFHTIDLSEDGASLAPGFYLLETNAPQMADAYSREQRAFFLVSQLGLTLKAGPKDGLVWATDLMFGKPMSGLEVLFYNDGQRLGQATTDGDGVAQLDLSQNSSINNLLAIIMPDTDGNGFGAVAEGWNSGISPYQFGLELSYGQPDYNMHLYTERSIYRPEQTVYFKGIIRREDDVKFSLPDLAEVNITIYDAAYDIALEETLPVGPNSTFHGELALPKGAALGRYTINVEFLEQYFEQHFDVAAYRPPEFEVLVEPNANELLRGDDLSATIKAAYFFGGPLADSEVTWNVLAESYQFESRQHGSYNFYDADDPYVCFDCWWRPFESVPETVMSGSGTTDSAGQLTVELDGAELSDLLESGSYRLTLEATATGPDNQFISGRSNIVLHKGDYYIGLSPQAQVADAGEETAVDLLAVDWAGNRLAEKELDVQVIRREWVNTFIENEAGGGFWSYETQETLVDEFVVTTDEQGEAVARFTPPQGGSYQIVAQDVATLVVPKVPPSTDEADDRGDDDSGAKFARSPIRSALFIWVTGEDSVSWRRENHDRISLISDRTEYAPGETAEILIPSPFEGEHIALVTIERGRLLTHEVIPMSSSSHVYKLAITEQHVPNIYVSVVLLQGRTQGEREGDSPPLTDYKVGILPLDVTPQAQTLSISLTPDVAQAEPGDEVTYQLQVTDVNSQPVEAELSLDLVDKAVLSLQPRSPEAIVNHFYQRRGLGIRTAHSLAISVNRLLEALVEDLNLDKNEFFNGAAETDEKAFGGNMSRQSLKSSVADNDGAYAVDDMAMSASESMDMTTALPMAAPVAAPLPAGIDIRAEFSDTAYWNPVVVTDEKGQAELTVTLPDNLTTWVMRGVGLTAETAVGEATTELVSTKPLLIRPVAPRFFVVEDRADLAANLSNNTDAELAVEVTLSAEGLTLNPDTPAVQTVSVPAKGEATVTWDVTVNDVTQADLVFAAVSGEYQDAAKPRLSTGPDGSLRVYRYTAPDIVGTAGQLAEAGSRTEAIALPPLADPESGQIGGYDDRRGELTVRLDPSLAAGMQDGLDYLKHYEYECVEQTVSRFLPNLLTYRALQELGLDNPQLAQELPGLLEQGLEKISLSQKSDGGWGWWSDDERSNVAISAYVVFALTKAKQADVEFETAMLRQGQQFLLKQLLSLKQLNNVHEANQQAFILYALAEDGLAPAEMLAALFEKRDKLLHFGRAYLAMALHLSDETAHASELNTLLSDLNNAAILSATGAHWEEERRDWWSMNTDTRSTAIILNALTKLDPDNALNPNVVRWLMVARRDGIWETTQETAWALISLTDWMVQTGELKADYDYAVSLNQTDLAAGQVTSANVQESQSLSIRVSELLSETNNLLTVSRADGNGRLYYSAHLKVYLPVPDLPPVDRGIIVSRRYTLESCEPVKSRLECPEVREAKLGDVIRVDLSIIAPHDLYYVVVEDPLPAGAEAIDRGLATTSLLAMQPNLSPTGLEDGYYGYYWWWRWYSRSELRDEKVVLFTDYLPKGSYEYSYTMRATLSGDYQVIPTTAQEFYFPEQFGRGQGQLLSIGR